MDTNKMTIDKAQLKSLAEASLVGDWYESGDLRYEDRKTGDVHGLHHDDDRFIATANPATILALLEEISRIETESAYVMAGSRTRAEIIDQLKAENEALRKDAERYRWTAIDGNWLARMFGRWRAHTGEYGEANPTAWYPSRGEAIDAAISHAKALAKEASHG